jgi:PilZ domain
MATSFPSLSKHLLVSKLERRSARRFLPLPIVACKVELSDGRTPVSALLTDVAEGGIGIRTNRALAPETLLAVVLFNRHGLFTCARRAIVRYVDTRFTGAFQIGCQFDIPLDHNSLRLMHA